MTAHDIKSRYFTIGLNAMGSQIVTNVASLYTWVLNALGIISSLTQAVLYKRYHTKQVHGIDLNEGSAASAL